MAVLKQLHPAPSVPIQIPGIEGYELICTEAGRTNEGLTGSVAPKNGHITGDALRVCWPSPESCRAVRASLAQQLTTATRVDVKDTDVEEPLRGLYEAVESMLREDKRGDETQAARIVQLAQTWDLFHTPDGVAYVTFPGDAGEQQTWPLRSRVMRDRLEQVYFTTHGAVPGAQAVQDAIGVLAGKARFAGTERSVFLRLAEHEGVIYLDLCDPAWRVVAISAQGWRVIAGRDAPVRFRRTKGMLPLPEPQRGGCIATLRKFLNVAKNDDQAWRMIVAWLVAALRPRGPYPLLVCVGEHGAAKSTTQRLLRALIDPHRVLLRRPPRDERDLAIAGNNNWVLVFENVSSVQDWLSDALCVLATGGGFGTRALWENDEEALFDAQRPVMMNGIEVMLTRGDALDRALIVHLPIISDAERERESDLWPAFERKRPGILGALLDAVATALRRESSVRLKRLPRMADFAHWVTAAEPGLGWEDNSFLPLYDGVRSSTHSVALEASVIAEPLWTMMKDVRTWQGTARELLEKLNDKVEEKTRLQKGWPAQANALSGALTRIAPHLRALGLSVDMTRKGKAGKRIITLHLAQDVKSPSASSAVAQQAQNAREIGADQGTAADDQADDSPVLADAHLSQADDDLRAADDADDQVQSCSEAGVSRAPVQQGLTLEREAMTLPELMSALRAHGATLALQGDRVKVRAPAPLPATLMGAVRAHKANIVAALRDQGAKVPRTAAELVATLPHALCGGGCGRQTAYGWWCLSCRLAAEESA